MYSKVTAVILAAGKSSRMGSPKPIAKIEEKTFLERIIELYQKAGIEGIVVLGANSRTIRKAVDLSAVTTLENPRPERGQLSSLQTALPLVETASGIIVHPVDHPLVKLHTVQRLLSFHRKLPASILIPETRGRKGHPVLFPLRFLPDLKNVPQGYGARWVVRQNLASVHRVSVKDEGILWNIDTPETLRESKQLLDGYDLDHE